MPALSYLGVTLFAFLVSLAITPVVRSLARHVGLVDRPDANRKIHARVVPLGGGVAVLISLGLVILVAIPTAWDRLVVHVRWDLLGLAAGMVVLCAVGVLDDYKGLRARQKLLGQVIACSIVIQSGLIIRNVSLFGTHIELDWMSWPVTMFWLLGAINALNLIDGADGLATSVGIVFCGAIATMSMMATENVDATVALALMGTLLGFLVYNFPPATIFLGDAGSMIIGLLTGALAIRSTIKGPTTVAMLAPLAVWAVPAFDSAIAILRRKLTGRSISAGDRGHLHHCILRHGYGNRQMLVWVTSLCLITSGGAIASMYFGSEWFAIGGVTLVFGILFTTRIFGYHEVVLAANSFRDLASSLITPAWSVPVDPVQSTVRLQGSAAWEPLWQMLAESADSLDLVRMRLSLNLPWLHESYHASWQHGQPPSRAHLWRAEFPLVAEGRILGHLSVTGSCKTRATGMYLTKFAELFDSFEEQLAVVVLQAMQSYEASQQTAVVPTPEVAPSPPTPVAGEPAYSEKLPAAYTSDSSQNV